MTSDTTDPHAGQWPDASLRPSDDAPPAEHARFYRDHCGWIVLPTAGPRDVMAYTISLHNEAVAAYAADHGDDIPDDVSAELWDDAREIASATLGRPIGYIYKAWMAKVAVASDVTDEMIALAWEPLERSTGPRAAADERGICILPNRSAKGLPVCLVDVDAGHGEGSPAGDMDGRWGWGLAGPKASTPRGGLHTLVLGTGKETASADLGPGIDVVAGGGTTIPLPAGSATPGRRWLRWDPPVVAPEEMRKRGRKKAPPRVTAAGGGAQAATSGREPGEDFEDEGRAAALIASEIGDGERNWSAAAIVGILARPRACPDDFVRACLVLCAEVMAGRDASRDDIADEHARWSHALTRGPRDATFAAEVLATWVCGRDTSRRPWTEAKATTVALSLWKTCDRREEGLAGAEDFGVGPALAAWPETWPPMPSAPPAPLPTPAPAAPSPTSSAPSPAPPPAQPPAQPLPSPPADPVPYPPPPPGTAPREPRGGIVIDSPWRGGIDPRTYMRTLLEQYTDDDLLADESRSPIQIDEVFPACDFVTGRWLTGISNDERYAKFGDREKTPLFHGWGEHLGRALGGLAPRDFRVIGASGAGAGKTWFESWLAHGLAFATAARILGMKGFEDAPLVLPMWLTEMPKPGELFLRAVSGHLGIPMDVVTEGTSAASSPRVIEFAQRLKGGWTPEEVVKRSRERLRIYGSDERYPLGFARRHVIRTLSIAALPRVTRHRGVAYDHRGGFGIIDHMADAIDMAREDLAKLAGVSADQILPLAIVDPGQRFASSTESSEKRAIDGLFEAIRQTLCMEVGAAVLATSDTTKAGARKASDIDTFLSESSGALGADIFAGSQAIQHQADCIALQAEPAATGSGTTRTWIRIFKSRAGGTADVAYPFTWEMGLGRFKSGAPEPLREPQQQADRRSGGGAPSQYGAPPPPPRMVSGYATRAPREHAVPD